MKKVLFATENKSKAERFKKGLLENGIEIITINDLKDKVTIDEDGKNAIENALIKDGKEYTYTWSKEDFYIVDKPTDKINPGYPLNTISINKKLNKYFTDITEEDKLKLHEDESHVVKFLVSNLI